MNAIKPPVMAYRIGIVGNRDLSGVDTRRLDAEIFRLIEQLDSGMTKIWELHNADSGRMLYDKEKPRLYMVNSLAEGADQLAARVASRFVAKGENQLNYRFKLSCPIPFPEDEYKKHFGTDEGRAQFDELINNKKLDSVLIEMDCNSSTPEHRREGYRAAADMLVENIDILIAIYDADRESSRGGSKETHHVAQQRNIPVIHIDTKNLDSISLYRSASKMFDAPEPVTDEIIDELMADTLLPSSLTHGKEKPYTSPHVKKTKCINEACHFFNEPLIQKKGVKQYALNIVHGCYSLPWKALYGFLKLAESKPESKVRCDGKTNKAESSIELDTSLYCRLKNDVDELAVQYMNSYRGSFILNFLLGAIAVFLAVLSFFAFESPIWSYAELIVLCFILVTYLANRICGWKKKAVDYRFIAEYFRHVEMLALLGRVPKNLQPTQKHNAHHDPASTWMGWYVYAVIRSQGLFRNIKDYDTTSLPTRINFDIEYIDTVKKLLCNDWFLDQYNYHLLLTKRYERWEKIANIAMTVIFFIIIAGVVEHLVHWGWWYPEGWHKYILVALSVTAFPALLASIHGITVQGEFERLAKRSEATADYLEKFINDFNNINSQQKQYADAVGDHAIEAAQVMLEEVTDWQILYRAHGVELT